MANVYDMILKEFKARNASDYDKFPPYFISSVGCHFFNIINQQKHMFTEAGLTVNTRLHIIFVAPQGQQKSFWLKQFLQTENSILKGSNIRTDFELRMSEAGYLGTIKFGDNNIPIVKEGLCQEEMNSIVGIEEFSDLMQSMSAQDYNIGLENELLTTLDSGMAVKRLAAGKLEYNTNLTLWTATQPARYNLTSGLGRRFLFIFNVPTEKSMMDLKLKRRAATDIDIDESNLFEIKKECNMRLDEVSTRLNKIRFDNSFYDYLDRLNVISYEEPLYERLALGYHIMNSESIGNEIVVSPDHALKALIKQEWGWRKRIKSGTEDSMVWSFIESTDGIREERCHEVLMDFGMALKDARKSIRELEKRDLIEIVDGKIKKKKKKEIVPDVTEQAFLQ